MKHWEEYFYEVDKKYNEEELQEIKKAIKGETRLTCIFLPIVVILVMAIISLTILSIVLEIKVLDAIDLGLFCGLLATIFLWIIFYMRAAKNRAEVMKKVKKEYKKPC